jgi:hypothetical protein
MDNKDWDALTDGCTGPFSCMGQVGTVFIFGVGVGLAFVLGACGLPPFLAFFVPFICVGAFWYFVLEDMKKK